jgi:phytoene dehydrogenase-like protein
VKAATVVGAGPNGLTAAIILAQAGIQVTVLEAAAVVGGGARSGELTLPEFVHDMGSAVHPMALASPVFRTFPLAQHGLRWIQPPVPLAHPLDDGSAVVLERSLEETARRLGADGASYTRTMGPLVARWQDLFEDILSPIHFPKHPVLLAQFGMVAGWPATWIARSLFKTTGGSALFAGLAAHSVLPLENLISASFGWVLGLTAHAVGWPIPQGGAQQISNALASYFQSLGGRIVTNTRVHSLAELDTELVLCDVTPRQLLRIAGSALPDTYRRSMESYRYGAGVFKLDWALEAPIPWTAAECRRAGTVHLGGTLAEIAASERAPSRGMICDRPFVLLTQPSLFDATRAPAGKHVAWAYCHIPNGSQVDMTERMERQVERFAPGFRKTILARSVMAPADLERYDANLVGGDIGGGMQDLRQMFLRPGMGMYRTPRKGLYLCSSSTPPGGAVHGMCGFNAALAVKKDLGIV